MTARIVLTITLSCIFYQAFFHLYWQSYFPPASWAVLSACIWTTCVFLRGWNTLGVWDKRQFLWGALSCLWFLNFLQTNKDFQGWGDVYFFCGHHMEYCTCDFRWNLQGWAKAAVLWNFVLSAALGMQRLAIQLGLCGLLPGEEVVTRESFISICWRLIPYWLNNWEQQWGAECSSMMFELPHFAIELLVILPCVQILCARMKILAVPQPGPLANEADQDVQRDNYAPNILKGQWELSPGHKKFMKRLRGNMRIMTFTVAISALAAFNALSMPLQLERQILQHPHAATTLLAGRSVSVLDTLPKMKPMRAQYIHAHRAQAMQQTPLNHTIQPTLLDNHNLTSSVDNMSYANSTSALKTVLDHQQGAASQSTMQQHYVQSRPPPGSALLPLSWLISLFQDDCDTVFCLITGIKFVPIDEPMLPPGIHAPSSGQTEVTHPAGPDTFEQFTASREAADSASAALMSAESATSAGNSSGPAVEPPASLAGTVPLDDISTTSSTEQKPSDERNSSLPSSSSPRPTASRRSTQAREPAPLPLPTVLEIRGRLNSYAEKLPNTAAPVDPEQLEHLLDADVNAFAEEYLNMFSLSRKKNPAPPKELLRDAKKLVIYPRLKKYAERCPSTAQLQRTMEKHAKEISKMQDPEHKILIPLVESALAVMRLSCEKFFVLVTVFVAYLIFREPPPVARFIIRLNSRLSTTFQRIILYSFPAVCWIYGAGFIFSTFVSIVFWGGPVLMFYESFRNAISVVCIKSLRPSTPEEVERMGGNCAICWGEMCVGAHTSTAAPAEATAADPRASLSAPISASSAVQGAVGVADATSQTPEGPSPAPADATPAEMPAVPPVPAVLEADPVVLPVEGSMSPAADLTLQDAEAVEEASESKGAFTATTSSAVADNGEAADAAAAVAGMDDEAAGVVDVQVADDAAAAAAAAPAAGKEEGESSSCQTEARSHDAAEPSSADAQAGSSQTEEGGNAAAPVTGQDDPPDTGSIRGAQGDTSTGELLGGSAGGIAGESAGGGGDEGTAAEASSSSTTEGHSLPCGHAYHHACLTQWLHQCHAQSIAPTCPMCQQSIQLEVRWRFPIPWRNPYAALAVDLDQQNGAGPGGGGDDGMAGLLDHQRELQELLQDMPQIMAPEGFRDQLEVLQQQMMDEAAWPELVPMEEEPAPREPDRPVAAAAAPAQDTSAAEDSTATASRGSTHAHTTSEADVSGTSQHMGSSQDVCTGGSGITRCDDTAVSSIRGSAGAPQQTELPSSSSCHTSGLTTSSDSINVSSSACASTGMLADSSSLSPSPVLEAPRSQLSLKSVLFKQSKDSAASSSSTAGLGVKVSSSDVQVD